MPTTYIQYSGGQWRSFFSIFFCVFCVFLCVCFFVFVFLTGEKKAI